MKINDFAKLCGSSPRKLRHYEKMGLLTSTRSLNGYRTYSSSQVKVVKQIQWLLETRMSLEKIKYIVPCTIQKTKIHMCKDLQTFFRDEISNIDKEISNLKRSKRLLEKTLKESVLVD